MNKKQLLILFAIAIVGALLYIQTIPYGFSGDDGIYAIYNVATKQGLGNWKDLLRYGSMNFLEINPSNTSIYRPFTLLTFAIEHEIFGRFSPKIGHTLNIILYAGVLSVLGLLLTQITEKSKQPFSLVIFTLLLFATHPIHTEVVASIKSRDTLLSALFGFAAIVLWLSASVKQRKLKMTAIGFLYFLALTSKEEALPLIAIVFLIAYFFEKKDFFTSAKETIPFVIPGALYLVLRGIVLDSPETGTALNSTVNSLLYGLGQGEFIATNLFIYLQYIRLLIFPHPLSWDYSFSQFTVQKFTNPIVWLSVLFFGLLIYWGIKGFKDRKMTSFWILFYLVTFSIFANLTAPLIIGTNLGERFLFTPSLAYCFLLVFGIYLLVRNIPYPKQGMIMGLALSPLILGYTWKTIDRSKVWESNLTLAESGIITAPHSWRTHAMYGEELRLIGKEKFKTSPDDAHPYFERANEAFEISHQILGPKQSVSTFLYAHADVLLHLGDTLQAMSLLEEVVIKNPSLHFAHFQLGSIHFQNGDFEKAQESFLKSITPKNSNLLPSFKNLGLSYLNQNKLDEAINALKNAMKHGEDPTIDDILSQLYLQKGDFENANRYSKEAIANPSPEELQFLSRMKEAERAFTERDFKRATLLFKECIEGLEDFGGTERFPNYYKAFGRATLETRDTLAAKSLFLKALASTPKDTEVLTNLGTIAFLKDRNLAESERYFSAAVSNNPQNLYQAHLNLGSVLLAQRKEKEALLILEKALTYGSDPSLLNNLYLISKSLGNQEKMKYYENLIQQKKGN